MKLEEKLQVLRKKNGYSQEQLADKLGTARQTISKWETGQAVPELSGLISLSELYGVPIDRIVKDNDGCNLPIYKNADIDLKDLIPFLICAKKNTYPVNENKVVSSRLKSHDFSYCKNGYKYLDSYFGGEHFSGSETVWYLERPIWGMNYMGRITGEYFNSDFLKEALLNVPSESPYRGPKIFVKGDYHYHCKTEGAFVWFQGYEEIFYLNEKIYECYFHGGMIR